MARRLATAALTLGCMHASVVAALGLGELRIESFLNEPLTATVDLLNTGGMLPSRGLAGRVVRFFEDGYWRAEDARIEAFRCLRCDYGKTIVARNEEPPC